MTDGRQLIDTDALLYSAATLEHGRLALNLSQYLLLPLAAHYQLNINYMEVAAICTGASTVHGELYSIWNVAAIEVSRRT